MPKEGPAPVTAYMGGLQTVLDIRKVVGDEGNDIQRNAIDLNEGVPPLADICRRNGNIPVKLRNIVEGEAVEEVSPSLPGSSWAGSHSATYDEEYATRFNSSFKAKAI